MSHLQVGTAMDVDDNDDIQLKPKIGMVFDSEVSAYEFYNAYGGKVGFSVRRGAVCKSRGSGELTSRTFVCSKQGYRIPDKRAYLTRNHRAKTRTGCGALMGIKLDRECGKYSTNLFVEFHNHPLIQKECIHMLPSQRKISTSQSVEIGLAEDFGIPRRSSFELMGTEAEGRECVGLLKTDQKNYLRTRRQRMLAFGDAGGILKCFQDQTLQNSSFFYAVQLDSDELITNIFWADAKMILDYGQFGDVVTFDTTYKINRKSRPFAVFVGFNNHRESIVFGAALMYDETADSFIWLFETFLEAMSNKHPKTIFTDQDAAMAKAISFVMPDTYHRLCTWRMMQNTVKHVNHIFQGPSHIRGVLGKFMNEYEEEDEWEKAWNVMLDEYDVRDNKWLAGIFDLRRKWARPYVRWSWSAGMKSTQLSESFNADLKNYLNSDYNFMQFFTHFDRVLNNRRYKESEAEYALSYRLPKPLVPVQILIQTAAIYTKIIFEEFQDQYVQSLELRISSRGEESGCSFYTIAALGQSMFRQVKKDVDGFISCSCRLFEMRGVLCCHALRVLREEMGAMELPSEYILKRWTRNARSQTVQDLHGHDVQVDPKLEQTSRYKSLCSIFNRIACRGSELEDTYKISFESGKNLLAVIENMLQLHLGDPRLDKNDDSSSSIMNEHNDNESVPKAKGVAKKSSSHRGKRRIKGPIERALMLAGKKRAGLDAEKVLTALLGGRSLDHVETSQSQGCSTHCSQVQFGENSATPNVDHP